MATARQTSAEPRRTRRRYSAEEKARLVAAARVPDASVARIAREHGLNANLLFGWLRQAQQRPALLPAPALVPITLADEPAPAADHTVVAGRTVTGTITVECRRGVVRVEGMPDPATLHAVLETLLR